MNMHDRQSAVTPPVAALMAEIGVRARAAASVLAFAAADRKTAALEAGADAIETRQDDILAANAADMAAASERGLSAAFLDRLELTEKRIAGMAQALREIAALPD